MIQHRFPLNKKHIRGVTYPVMPKKPSTSEKHTNKTNLMLMNYGWAKSTQSIYVKVSTMNNTQGTTG